MPKPHLPGPRLVLQEDVWDWLATRSRRFQFGAEARLNLSELARASRCSVSYLSRVKSGELPVSLELVAGMVKASGMDATPRQRMRALEHILDWIDPEAEAERQRQPAVAA